MYHHDVQDYFLTVSPVNCTVFASAKADTNYSHASVARFMGWQKDTCEEFETERHGPEDWNTTDKRMYKGRVTWNGKGNHNGRAKTTMRNFKKIGSSNFYRNAWAMVEVAVDGQTRGLECDTDSIPWAIVYKQRWRKRITVRAKLNATHHVIRSGDVCGGFETSDGTSTSECVIW